MAEAIWITTPKKVSDTIRSIREIKQNAAPAMNERHEQNLLKAEASLFELGEWLLQKERAQETELTPPKKQRGNSVLL